jgi:hypothetical protein
MLDKAEATSRPNLEEMEKLLQNCRKRCRLTVKRYWDDFRLNQKTVVHGLQSASLRCKPSTLPHLVQDIRAQRKHMHNLQRISAAHQDVLAIVQRGRREISEFLQCLALWRALAAEDAAVLRSGAPTSISVPAVL